MKSKDYGRIYILYLTEFCLTVTNLKCEFNAQPLELKVSIKYWSEYQKLTVRTLIYVVPTLSNSFKESLTNC